MAGQTYLYCKEYNAYSLQCYSVRVSAGVPGFSRVLARVRDNRIPVAALKAMTAVITVIIMGSIKIHFFAKIITIRYKSNKYLFKFKQVVGEDNKG